MGVDNKSIFDEKFISQFGEEELDLKKVLFILKNISIKRNKPLQWFLKRLIDFSLSLCAIIILSPILFLIAVIIMLESKGPAIYKQKRIGFYNKPFYMYKFRSMKVNADKIKNDLKSQNQTNPIMFKMYDDPRITKVGKFLRKYSIDEIPQLFNVLMGEMSLVGPRPPLPDEVEKYENWHYLRFATLPGITGRWQTSGRSRIKCFDRVVRLDYKYISSWNLMSDIKILLKTLPVVVSTKGAA